MQRIFSLFGASSLGTLAYAYDLAGRRTVAGGSFARSGLPAALSGSVYNANNQQTQFGAASLTYDANGNLTSDGKNSYTWNARNQLVAIGGSVAANFQYDAFGRRVSKTIGGTTQYLYDGANPVEELSGETVTASLLAGGIDEYFQRTDRSGPRSFLTDALGSTVALADPAGALATQYTYDPFGNTTSSGAATTNSIAFTGRELDATGLYFYRARYYSPQLQRFSSEDPIQFESEDVNLYRYVWDNPANFIDSFGWWGAGVQGNASAGAGLGLGAIGTAGGGIGVFGGKGLNAGAYGTAGAFAGVGPYGPRYPDTPGSRNWGNGYVLGYGLGIGAGLFLTNAKNVCDLKGPFKTFTISGGTWIGGALEISWSNGIFVVSPSVTLSPLPWPSGMASLIYTNTAVKPLTGRKHGCN